MHKWIIREGPSDGSTSKRMGKRERERPEGKKKTEQIFHPSVRPTQSEILGSWATLMIEKKKEMWGRETNTCKTRKKNILKAYLNSGFSNSGVLIFLHSSSSSEDRLGVQRYWKLERSKKKCKGRVVFFGLQQRRNTCKDENRKWETTPASSLKKKDDDDQFSLITSIKYKTCILNNYSFLGGITKLPMTHNIFLFKGTPRKKNPITWPNTFAWCM